ncbi:MAG: hypothetical protein U9O94_10770 [Nanoarchaeota archaeon]|nr:hypothetical protein [Nanoarchaeota archaeon]
MNDRGSQLNRARLVEIAKREFHREFKEKIKTQVINFLAVEIDSLAEDIASSIQFKVNEKANNFGINAEIIISCLIGNEFNKEIEKEGKDE